MTKNLPEDKIINREIKNIKKDIHIFNSSRVKKINESRVKNRFTSRLTGYIKCSECHNRQFVFWQETSHAESFQTLLDKKESKNLDCIICHVTQEPELFIQAQKDNSFLLSLNTELNRVGCESCHGAGLAHINNPSYFKLDRKISTKICENCHTPERDIDFNYDIKRGEIACPAD